MTLSLNNSILKTIKEYLFITVGLVLYAFGFITLLIPANTVPGGAGGIASLIFYALGSPTGFLSVGTLYFIVNAILLVFGLIIIGPKFGIKTIYAIVLISIMMNIFELTLPADLLGLSATAGDQLLMVILGGVMCGVGVATCFMQGGSSGGTDIIAMIINKYHNVSFGRIIMACDALIIACSVWVFKGDLKPAVYGIVTLASVGYTIDLAISGSRQSTQIMVFSPKYKEIGNRIISDAHRGVTYLYGEGGYTGAEQKIVNVVCRRSEQSEIYRIIKDVDPDAFITSAAVTGAYGKGFEMLKVKSKSK